MGYDSVRDSNHVRGGFEIWSKGFCKIGDRNKRRNNRVHFEIGGECEVIERADRNGGPTRQAGRYEVVRACVGSQLFIGRQTREIKRREEAKPVMKRLEIG
jgi:hypothetical protein